VRAELVDVEDTGLPTTRLLAVAAMVFAVLVVLVLVLSRAG
jgi:hypothetical protein